MTDAELQQIRERAEKATPGPWEVSERDGRGLRDPHSKYILGDRHEDEEGEGIVVLLAKVLGSVTSGTIAKDNAVFIAHARTDVPALLAEVERLRVAIDDAAGKLEFLNGRCIPSEPLVEIMGELYTALESRSQETTPDAPPPQG